MGLSILPCHRRPYDYNGESGAISDQAVNLNHPPVNARKTINTKLTEEKYVLIAEKKYDAA